MDEINSGKIPSALKQPTLEKRKDATACCVTFDLETTGFQVFAHLTQIAATTFDGSQKFACYALPTIPISPGGSKVTGLIVSRTGNKPVLISLAVEVCAISQRKVLQRFTSWLNGLPQPVLLASHNCT